MFQRKEFNTKTLFFLAVLSAVLVVMLFSLFNSYIYQQKQLNPPPQRYRTILVGEYLCLPHTDTTEPQTEECAFGIKTDTGDYYAIDFHFMSQTSPELSAGNRIQATGVVTPLELLSTDHWRKYPVKGIFSVTDSLQVLDQ